MINARNIIITSVVVLVLSLAANVITLMSPNDNGGIGRDSYGYETFGYRGIFETIEQLGLPISRSHVPFSGQVPTDSSYVLIAPDSQLLASEQGSLNELVDWVRRGGRLVICFNRGWIPNEFKTAFDIESISVRDISSKELLTPPGLTDPEKLFEREMLKYQRDREKRDEELEQDLRDLILRPIIDRQVIQAQTAGDHTLTLKVQQTGLAVLNLGTLSAKNTVRYVVNSQGTETPIADDAASAIDTDRAQDDLLAATLEVGSGQVCLLSDPTLFDNLSLLDSDNSILLVDQIVGDSDSIVVDEFYHGLSIRGNAIWIFAQPGYRLIVLALLFAVGLWGWREAISLGTLRDPLKPARRTLTTYLDAVSHLMLRTKQHSPQLIELSRQAFVWRVAHQLQLPSERSQPDQIARFLERSDPAAAAQFNSLLSEFDQLLQNPKRSSELLSLLQRSQRCPS